MASISSDAGSIAFSCFSKQDEGSSAVGNWIRRSSSMVCCSRATSSMVEPREEGSQETGRMKWSAFAGDDSTECRANVVSAFPFVLPSCGSNLQCEDRGAVVDDIMIKEEHFPTVSFKTFPVLLPLLIHNCDELTSGSQICITASLMMLLANLQKHHLSLL